VKERTNAVREARSAFKAFTGDVTQEYREKVRLIDTEFEFKLAEMEAARDAKIATAEAEFQKKRLALFTQTGVEYNEATIQKLEEQWTRIF